MQVKKPKEVNKCNNNQNIDTNMHITTHIQFAICPI